MAQRESRLSGRIMKELRLNGAFCFKIHGGATMMAGLPDIIVCVGGEFVGLEVKLPGKRDNTSPTQKLVHSQIEQAGGRSFVVTSVQEALRVCGLQGDD